MLPRLVSDIFLRASLALSVAFAVSSLIHEKHLACHASAHPHVMASSFGIRAPCGALIPTDHVPLLPGLSFGWRVAVDSDDAPVTWREEIILPSAPRTWSSIEPVEIQENGLIAVTERTEYPMNGMLEHSWSFTEGDPLGAYEIRITIDDMPVETFLFDVQ